MGFQIEQLQPATSTQTIWQYPSETPSAFRERMERLRDLLYAQGYHTMQLSFGKGSKHPRYAAKGEPDTQWDYCSLLI
jgi:predicted secreted protein